MNLTTKLKNNHGAIAVVVGIAMTALIGFAALAIDLGHLYVVKNELQNAADAGALAGASVLYNDGGTAVNTDANQTASDAAAKNSSDGTDVEVHGLQDGDAQRGHWSFATRTFEPKASTNTIEDLYEDGVDISTVMLDGNEDFINAVRVRTWREDTPAASFLARIFGHENFTLSADAVAYIGFAGTLVPGESDMPIAICEESILKAGKYSCSEGTMIPATTDSAKWTSYEQQINPGDSDPCQGGTNAHDVGDIIYDKSTATCLGGNARPVILGKAVAILEGQAEPDMVAVKECWEEDSDTDGNGIPDIIWNLRLPVIKCEDSDDPDACSVAKKVVGVVNVNVVWITGTGEDPQYNDIPLKMGDWSAAIACSEFDLSIDTERKKCWDEFVQHYQLKDPVGGEDFADYKKKTIYFRPDCEYHEPAGRSNGNYFGVLANIPALVE